MKKAILLLLLCSSAFAQDATTFYRSGFSNGKNITFLLKQKCTYSLFETNLKKSLVSVENQLQYEDIIKDGVFLPGEHTLDYIGYYTLKFAAVGEK